jgi:hypothetical protein
VALAFRPALFLWVEKMKTDAYTKTLLTIIAACLLWLCVMSAGQPVSAQPQQQYSPLPAQPVVVVGWGRLNPAARGGIELAWSDSDRKISEPAVPIRPGDPKHDPLRVRVDLPAPLPVSLEAVKKGKDGAWDALRTAAEADSGSRVPGIRQPK